MKKNEQIVFEMLHWKVILIPDQLYLGRSVVVLKRQCGDLADLSQEEMLDFLELVKKLQNLLKKTFGATMFNWSCLMNNAYQVNPAKPQVHWHFRARYQHPVKFAGHTFKDPNFGHHAFSSEHEVREVPQKLLKAINLELQKNLE